MEEIDDFTKSIFMSKRTIKVWADNDITKYSNRRSRIDSFRVLEWFMNQNSIEFKRLPLVRDISNALCRMYEIQMIEPDDFIKFIPIRCPIPDTINFLIDGLMNGTPFRIRYHRHLGIYRESPQGCYFNAPPRKNTKPTKIIKPAYGRFNKSSKQNKRRNPPTNKMDK